MMDSTECEVVFGDGSTEEHFANSIAENLFAHVDDEGRHLLLFKEIVDHRKDETAVPMSEGTIRSRNGNEVLKKTTRGWKLQVEWKDGTHDWIPLKTVKDSNPAELAECAIANKIDQEPAFKWWVPHVMHRRNQIIGEIKSRHWKTTHKFGIQLPHSVEEALEID